MNVSRRLPDNTVNPKEPNTQKLFMTSAGMKGSFSYDLLIDSFQMSIIEPHHSFVFGCDYRVPMLHGLLDRDYINKIKMSPSFSEESFSAEYASIWRGGADEAWYSYDKLQKYRKIKNPEWHAISRRDMEFFYLLSVDVGRVHDQTAVNVFRVNITEEKFYCTLVNLIVLGRTPETKPFSVQARDLKRLIKLYKPKCVVIDGNGLGLGLCDEMIKVQLDDETGDILPAYGFTNNDDYRKIQPKDAQQILYMMKANHNLKSQINGNAYSMLMGGRVRFLIKELEAKMALLSTKKGKSMSHEQRIKRLMPHEMTTRLFDEMGNLRIKKTGTDIILEPINQRFPDDKYYSFAYCLWRIKELEEEYFKRKRRRSRFGSGSGSGRGLIFYSGG